MYEFIRLQYIMGKIMADQVRAFSIKWITAKEAEQILDIRQ